MAVSEVYEALGSFEFELLGNVPREVLDSIDYFGHIAVIPGRLDPRQYGEGCLDAARYVGVVRSIKIADDGRTNLIQDDIRIGGVGMEFWLGDEDNKGAVFEELVEFNGENFSTVMSTLRPSAVGAGTVHAVSGTYSGRHQYETPRSAIKYVCETVSTELVPVTYRVNNDATLDAGPVADLYVTSPTCIVMRKGSTQGEDMFLRALPSTVDLDQDMEDFTTRVVMLAESDGESLATGSADIGTIAPGVNTYKDLYGNDLVLTRLVSESETLEALADTRAELALRGVISPHRTLTLAAMDYDIHGSFKVGDYIWVYDPDAGLVDTDNEVMIRGVRINPMKLRVTEADWPICEGYTVAFRDSAGNWTDLTDYIHWEEPVTAKVTVGDFNRDLVTDSESISVRLGSLGAADNTVPGQVEWVLDSFQTVAYQDVQGDTKARQKLVWDTPLNASGSAITDGSHYELQYKLDTGSLYSQTWAAAGTLSWDEGNTWNQPVEPDDVEWQTVIVPWGENSTVIHGLPVGTEFDSRIRAVDKGNNQGEWSLTETWSTHEDNIPPSTPAAAVVAGNPLSIQVIHELGKASGGTFNLENDLGHLEIHYSQDDSFFPDANSLAGRLTANRSMLAAGTAAVGTFPIPETAHVFVKVIAVDRSGNKSSPSVAAEVTAELIDSQYVSELTASKISAGTLSANILLGASIRTAESGARMEINADGMQAYDSDSNQTVDINAETGAVEIQGDFETGTYPENIEIKYNDGSARPEITLRANANQYGLIYADDFGETTGLSMETSPLTVGSDDYRAHVRMSNEDTISGGVRIEHTKNSATVAKVNVSNEGVFISKVEPTTLEDVQFLEITEEQVLAGDHFFAMNETVGRVSIVPVANTPTSSTVSGLGMPSGNYWALATAHAAPVGSEVRGVGVSSITNNAVTIHVYRTNTDTTHVCYAVMEVN